MKRNMKTHHTPRADAVDWNGRDYVPTVYGQKEGNTIWVGSWTEFRAVGGCTNFNEDQTEVTLTLPVGHKFSVGFYRHGAA